MIMTVKKKVKFHPNVVDFKELPFYNKYIENQR